MRFCSACGSRFSNDTRYCPIDGQPTMELAEDVERTDPLIGRVLDGRYRIERSVGEGGMGIVYLATHVTLNKRMAVKVLRGEMARDQDVVQRFVQEAQASSAIGHPNIIDISDFGRLPDNAVFFVMEYLEGEPLTDRISRSKGLQVREALPILEQIASALSSAHSAGIVHRDMKPDNIFLIQRGQTRDFVKVLDFGIAKVGGAASKLTKTGTVFGTPHYMSPEQAAGQMVDQRTDIYALGVIMYEMVTGKVPFDADTFMGILSKHMFEPPRPPTEVGEKADLGALEPVILRALAKKPEQRYQSMDDLIVDLGLVRSGERPNLPMTSVPVPNLGPRVNEFARHAPAQTVVQYAPGAQNPQRHADDGADGALGFSRRTIITLFLSVFALLAIGVIAGGAYAFTRRAATVTAAADHVPSSPTPSPNAPTETVPPSSAPVIRTEMVRIESSPGGAAVTVDGATIGVTPVSMPKPTGADVHPIELTLAGYEVARFVVTPSTADVLSIPLAAVVAEAPRVASETRPSTGPRPSSGRLPPSTPAVEIPPPTMVAPAGMMPATDVIDPWE